MDAETLRLEFRDERFALVGSPEGFLFGNQLAALRQSLSDQPFDLCIVALRVAVRAVAGNRIERM